MDRLEFLVATGGAPFANLADIFKLTASLFKRKHPQYQAWLQARQIGEARRRARQLQQQQQQQQQQSGSATALPGLPPAPRERRTRSSLAGRAASRATP